MMRRMPTVLRSGPYRFIFFSLDGIEPPHVHVFRDEAQAKFWLNPVRFESSRLFRPVEERRIERLVSQHQQELLEAWNEYFSD
jgi:hypothetical protein